MDEEIIIIGAGVSGITTGLVLQLLGYSTEIYTDQIIENFNEQGDPAFASLYPAASVIPHTVYSDRLESLYKPSQKIFYHLRKQSFEGLTFHKHYEVFEDEKEPPSYLDWMLNVRSLEDQQDVPRRNDDITLYGWVFDCFFTDWPVYFPYLISLYRQSGGNIQKKSLSKEDISELPAEIVVNCSGLGSRLLFEDEAPHELVRGHLLHVSETPLHTNSEGEILSYNYTPKAEIYSDAKGNPVDVYWYPRKDGWILGGSRQYGTVDTSGNWNGDKTVAGSYEKDNISYPRQIWDLNREVLDCSYGLDLKTFNNNVTPLKGYRYIRSRPNGLRLESEEINDKLIIHNYGHGGAGITLSWGCAIEIQQIIESEAAIPDRKEPAELAPSLKRLQSLLHNFL